MAKNKESKLLTGFLSKILKEKHSVKVNVGGKMKTITKGEALARHMVAAAIGYAETVSTYDKSGAPSGTVEVLHSPDRNLAKEILDRVEGKAATTGAKEDDSRPSVADKVTELGAKRLNDIAKKSSLKI
ncbi:unnamed protein product [marine sediment metagenome]|uniref:Uncharacterized protein n=1 Tax=marine sediment metagenome TaxID=412755 RepID=X1H016_9ZZZZ